MAVRVEMGVFIFSFFLPHPYSGRLRLLRYDWSLIFPALNHYWLVIYICKDAARVNSIPTNPRAKDRICLNMGIENIKLAKAKSAISAVFNA